MSANPSTETPGLHPFTDEEAALVRRMAGAIIGPSVEYDVPGADDPAISARILRRAAKQAGAIQAAVAEFASAGAARASLAALGDAEFAERLRTFAAGQPAFAGLMSWLVASSYYEDERVLRSLGLEGRPPFPKGHGVEPSDWSLLEPVKRMDRLYREPPPK